MACIFQPAQSQPKQQDDNAELIVRPEEGVSLQETLKSGAVPKTTGDSLFTGVQSISSVFDVSRTLQKDRKKAVSIPAYRLSASDSASFRRLRTRWQQHPDVRYAHANVTFSVNADSNSSLMRTGPVLRNDNVLADSLDHLRVVQALDAWSATTGTTDVNIGIVDTGLFLNHPDLADQFWINEPEDINDNGQFDPYPADQGGDLNGVDDDGNGYVDDVVGYDFIDRPDAIPAGEFDDRDPIPSADSLGGFSWHGTAVAGVATSRPGDPQEGIAGVAPDTRLVALRAFGRDGRGRTDDIASAIVYGAEKNLDVLNLSFGRDRAVPLIEEAIEYTNAQGTILVGSAGNNLTDAPHYPSDYPDVLSVVWLGEDGELPRVNRSQFGIGVDLGAPGTNVYTTDFPADKLRAGDELTRSDLYRSPNGSSFSAPQVAGAAALLRSFDSSLSPASIRSILTATAEDIEGANWDHKTGAGLLNVKRALSRAYPARTEINRPAHNQGVTGQSFIPVVGTAVDPAFKDYALYYAEGTKNLDQRPDPWSQIRSPRSTQVLRDTLGVWNVTGLEEGEYTLRLVTTLQDGRTVEDRRRLRVDNSSPEIDLQFLGIGRVEGENGIVADVKTDDPTRVRLQVQLGNQTETVISEYQARRQSLTWADDQGKGGRARLQLSATNATGLTTTLDTTLQIPTTQENTGLLRRTTTSLPRGRLLPKTVDFDEDGLKEVVLNQFKEGGVTDTLRSFEWAGSGLVPKDTLAIGPFLPKDVGDTNGDGLQELLLQVRGATLLLEQPNRSAFPTDLIFADTSRISNAPGDTLNGARLTDLDTDGQGEILGSFEREWKLLERKIAGFQEIARLENPTELGPDTSLGNVFDFQEAATGDFDGDGRRNLLVGDRDGDLIVYEATGDDQIEPSWTFETDRMNAGTRFATGDFSGMGRTDFVTMTARLEAPEISYYSVWRRAGDNDYERAFRLPIPGTYTDLGAIAAEDVDGDSRPEVIIGHPPSLIVLDRSSDGSWRVLYEDRTSSLLSRSLLVADVSGSGQPSVYVGTNDNKLVRYVVDETALSVPPPEWTEARPTGASSTRLVWRAPEADSVTVHAGRPKGELNPVVTTTDSSVSIDGTASQRYAVRASRNGTRSPLSDRRTVRPHPPATVGSMSYPGPSTVRLQFTEPLLRSIRADQFHFGTDASSPERLVRVRNGTEVVLHFTEDVAGRTGQLTWSKLADTSGLGVGQTAATVSFPTAEKKRLFIEEVTILSERQVRLSFSAPLNPEAAQERNRYKLNPRGRVASVELSDDSSKTVTLDIENLVIGASGTESSLTVTEMISDRGNRLSEEGGTVRLTRPADDLSNVYVYPNPHRAQTHGKELTIAGLPPEATVRIYAPSGRLVRVLPVQNNRDGGRQWDLRDRRGERVPSGVYLIRVNAPEQSPVLEKAAVIR